MLSPVEKPTYTATRNACKLCAPLGASLVFKGIQGAVPLLHGSQGCSTYIRRYIISHFKEPVDIACSNFSEETAIFGGGANIKTALDNVIRQYSPELLGIATTCISETIGDDVGMFVKEYKDMRKNRQLPPIIQVSSASYKGTHMDGFHAAVRAVAETLAMGGQQIPNLVNLFPNMISPADLRHLREIFMDFGLTPVMLPDYSKTLDGPLWKEYERIPDGGTNVSELQGMGCAAATIEFGSMLDAHQNSAGKILESKFRVPCHGIGIPMGVNETDSFFNLLESISGKSTPAKHTEERGRLIDSYVDAHKYVSQAKAVVYGEEDLVIGLVSFLTEIGIIPIICASGGKSGHLEEQIRGITSEADVKVMDGVDFSDIAEEARHLTPDLFIGSSKGYSITKKLDVPLVRVGFPIHDRINGARILHVGYRGAQQLFDRVVNALIEKRQAASDVGYTYM